MVLFISNKVAEELLDIDDVIETLEVGYRELSKGDAAYRPRIDFYAPTIAEGSSYYRWGTMEGASKSAGAFAIRLKSDVTVWNRNTMDKFCGKPGSYCGLIFLFDTKTALPLAIINDGYVQHMRVGGSAGISAKYLSRKDSKVVGMIGSGGMAKTYAWAFSRVRNLELVKVYSPDQSHRRAFCKEMKKLLQIDIVDTDTPERAVRGSDIVATCTDSMRPVIKGEWLEAGMHVCNVTQNELGSDAMKRIDLKVRLGDPLVENLSIPEGMIQGMGTSLGSINGAMFSFAIGSGKEMSVIPKRHSYPERNVPTLIDIIAGRRKGRTSDKQITFIHNLGTQGLQFVMVGAKLYQLALKHKSGMVEIPTSLFLQNIRD